MEIFGTFPSWCVTVSVSPVAIFATPEMEETLFACDCAKVVCEPEEKVSYEKCWPALPSVERSVLTVRLAKAPPAPSG